MNDAVLHRPPMSYNTSDIDELKMPNLGEKEKLLNAQKDLLSSINPKLLKLCETLKLPVSDPQIALVSIVLNILLLHYFYYLFTYNVVLTNENMCKIKI